MKSQARIVVIVPTFNERGNIPVLLRRVFQVADAHHWDLEVLVVDDASPDGTAEAVRQEAREHGPRLRLFERAGERGLATAVVQGIGATEQEIIAVMDADLSHRPEDLPALLSPLLCGTARFALGSRYLPTSSIEDWSLFRRLNSRVPTLLSRPLTSVSDPLSGFFALSRSLLDPSVKLDPLGYKIGLELLVKTGCPEVAEVPIRFERRLHGRTKLTLREQLLFLAHLLRLGRFRLSRKRRSPAAAGKRRGKGPAAN